MLKTKETYWLIGTILFVIVLFFGTSGYQSFDLTSDTTINVYDTYYIIQTIHLFIVIATLIFFGVYLIRMLRRNFKNLTANVIFMISDISLILIFTFLFSMANSIRDIHGATYINSLLVCIQLILILLLTVSGIKTGVNYKRTE